MRKNPKLYLEKQLGAKPWEKQIDIIESVRDHRRTIVKGCIASSKTCAAAMVTLWWLHSHYPARVFTLAPTGRQVKINLWGEISALHGSSNFPIGGELLTTELKILPKLFAVGFSTDKPDRVHGIHGENDLLILDEYQGFKREMVEAIENAMAGGNSRMLALCNPNVLNGEVYDAFHGKRKLYNTISISALDTPNIKEKRTVISGMLSYEQMKEWLEVYGPNSNFCRVKVYAKFPKQESDTLIPLDWLEQAIHREVKASPKKCLGCDIARFGPDRTVLMPMAGRQVYKPDISQGQNVMESAGKVAVFLKANPHGCAHIDVIGIGAGVVDRCQEQDLSVVGVNVAEKPEDPKKFADKRSELWYNARESFNPENPNASALPPDCPELIAELSSVKYRFDSAGRIKVESKDEMKKRLGKSPDLADAYCLALSAVRAVDGYSIEVPEASHHSQLEHDLERVQTSDVDDFKSGWIE